MGESAVSDLLADLDPEQRAVAEALEGPVVVSAGAGTGKTRAITHRIAHGVHTGAHVATATLAVTFTTRAAAEMRERLLGLGVDGVAIRTFHAAALRQLRFFWPRAIGGAPPDVLARPAPVVAEAAAACRLPTGSALVRDLVGEVTWAKQSQIAPDDYARAAAAAGRSLSVPAPEVAQVLGAYDDLMTQRHLADFDDVLLYTVALLERHADVADEIRQAYRWFTVDEYQDVSPLQQRLLDLWLGDRSEICVVGDAAQTIYTFAGASDRFLREFPQRFGGARHIRLIRNYRSTSAVCAVANRVVPDAGLVAQRGEGPAPTVTAFEDDPAEAEGVAACIAGWIADGIRPRDIAVLVRSRAQLAPLESACADAGIPLVVRGGERFFDRAEVREALTRLRGAARSGETGGSVVEIVRATLSSMGFADDPPRGSGAVRERWESLAALVALAGEAPPEGDIAGFIAELDRRGRAQLAPTADGVTLSTIHAAKGLEWEAVVVAGAAEGVLPTAAALGGGDDATGRAGLLAEEERLFYVAVTRARRLLHLTWAARRSPGGRAVRRRSRFVDRGLGEAAPTAAATSGPRPRRRRGPSACRVCQRALVTPAERALGRCRGCPGEADHDLVTALQEWRRSAAAARGVPAYVVLTDATLTALAEQRPADEAGLLAISGIGPDKLRRYGGDLLGLLGGSPGEDRDPRHADDAFET